jgi:hypothetical protein
MPTSRPLPRLLPERLRSIPRSFAWLDHRLRSQSLLQPLSPGELGFYLFLALAADKDGLSCWRLDRIEREIPCFDVPTLRRARDGLIRADLIAFKPWSPNSIDGSYQVLSVPPAIQRTQGFASLGQLLFDLNLGGARR